MRHEAGFNVPNHVSLLHPFGIRFGNCVFSEPVPVERAMFAASCIGIYVLLTPDPTWGPRHFQPVYFGEFAGTRHSLMTADEQMRCLRVAGGRNLYIAVYAIPPQHALELARMKNELIHRYTPIGNFEIRHEGVETRVRLEELQKKIQEHEVLLRLVLAATGQAASNQPEAKKRSAGFRADPAESRRPSPGRT